MAYETVTILDASGNPINIVVDTLTDGSKIQVVRADLGVDTTTAPVNNTIPVSASALPLPSGAATSALQTTGNASLATIAGAISGGVMQTSAGGAQYTEGDTDTTITGGAIMWEDAADTLRSVFAAKPLPVVQTGALPEGTAAIGKLAANDGVDIGNVDVASLIPGTGATNLGKAIGGAAGATDTGTAALFVRDDALSTLSDAEGDWVPGRVDGTGRLWSRTALDDGTSLIQWAYELEVSAAPTIYAAGAAAQYDSLHTTIMTFANAGRANGGSGRVLGARLISKQDSYAGNVALHLFRKSFTGTTAGDALAVSDTDKIEMFGTLFFNFGDFPPLGGGRVSTAARGYLPLEYKCDAGTSSIFGVLQDLTGGTTFGASDFSVYISLLVN